MMSKQLEDGEGAPIRHQPQRRQTTRKLALACFLTLLSLGLLHNPISYIQSHSKHHCHKVVSPEKRAEHILSQTPLIDGHVDFAIALRAGFGNKIDNPDFIRNFETGNLRGHVDLARLRQGHSGGAFWSVFAPCPENGTNFSDENYASMIRIAKNSPTGVQFTIQQIDVMNRLFARYPKTFASPVDSHNALHGFKRGKLISPLGVEGLHQIGNSAANLRMFHELGVRYATLTHNCHNKYADAALLEHPLHKAPALWGGVSPLGRKMIHEMNRIGMIVDLSHVSEDTMVDILSGKDGWEGSKAPVIFSHSSAWSVCPHPRNVKDHVLRLVKKRNSLVMVNIAPSFISCVDVGNANGLPADDPENATLDQVIKHIIYIGELIGYDHVGIGTDFDGIGELPTGLEDVSKYPDLVAALLRRGVSDRDAAKVVGGNLLRVWGGVDAVSSRMKAEGAPILEDEL